MTATLIVVTADFRSPSGETPTGEVIFDLSGTLSDAADLESVSGGQVKTELDAGQIAQPLVANDSSGLVPSSSYWITERIVGAAEHGYYAMVPSAPAGSRSVSNAAATVGQQTLSSASASFVSGDLGAFVFCTAFPVPSRITQIVSSTVAKLSTAAVSSGTGLAALIRASVDLTALRPL